MSDTDKNSPSRPLPDSMRTRDPWPMWPIGLAIVAFIAIYTWVNLEFRKEESAFEPYQAMLDRKKAVVEKNIYNWYSLRAEKTSTPASKPESEAQATSRAVPNALDELIPEQLKYYMPGKPTLFPKFLPIECPDSIDPTESLPLTLSVPAALVEDERFQLLSFYKEGELFILAALFVETLDQLEPELLAGSTAPVTFHIPTEPMAAESVTVRFLTEDRLTEWTLANRNPAAAVVVTEEE